MYTPTAPLATAVRWPVVSQQRARRNAMIASNALAQRRVELDEVEEFLATRRRAPGPGDRQAAHEPLSSVGRPAAAEFAGRGPPPRVPRRTQPPVPVLLARWGTIGACQPPQHAPPRAESIAFHDVLSDDGTRLRAWTNDPDGLPSTVRPWCSATASAPDRGSGRRSCARVRGPRRLVEPPRDRRLGPARRPPAGRHRGVRRGRPVRHGPLRRRPGRARGVVDGREHHVRARGPPPRAGLGALRRRGRPGRHVRDHARPAAPPARRRPGAHRETSPVPCGTAAGRSPRSPRGCRSARGPSTC